VPGRDELSEIGNETGTMRAVATKDSESDSAGLDGAAGARPIARIAPAERAVLADKAAPVAPQPPLPSGTSGPHVSAAATPDLSDGRVSRAQRLRHERSTQIQGVARTLFAQRGYHETSIQDILDGAGIARGTFYLHFDSKRAIFDLLIDDFLVRIQSVLTPVDVRPGAPPPLLQLNENLERTIAVLHDRRDLTRIILLLAEGLDADCDAKMAEFYRRVLDLLEDAIARGQKLHLIRPCNPRIVAQAALGSLKEVMLQWIVRRDSTPDELQQVCHELLSYSLHGLLNLHPGS
jgi:AcrR family transcriptional regulator